MNLSEINRPHELIKTAEERQLCTLQTYFLPLLLASMVSAAGCSSNPVQVQPLAVTIQSVSCDMGQLRLKSELPHPLGLTIVDYSEDEMIIEVSVFNAGDESFDFSDKSVKGKIVSSDRDYPVDVIRYDVFLDNHDDMSESAWIKTGSTAISVGSAFIPYGGIAFSVARLLFALEQDGGGSLQDRIDAQSYLRPHTVEPDTGYQGRLKINLPKQLESGDVLVFQISSADEIHDFRFLCQ